MTTTNSKTMIDRPTVIITGGCGYIGSHTAVELINSGYNVVLIDDFSNSDPKILYRIEKITGKQVSWQYNYGIPGEYIQLVEQKLDRDFKLEVDPSLNIIGLMHLAAYKKVGESVNDPLMYYDNNINSTIGALNIIKKLKIKNLIFSSSCTVYGNPDELPITEKSPTKPAQSPYGATKQISEQIMDDYHKANPDFNLVKLRYFNPIGAHPSAMIGELPLGVPDNLIPYMMQTADGIHDHLSVWGNDYDTPDGTCIRDYIHVTDLATSHIESLKWLNDKTGINEIFNVGTGKGDSVLEVIQTFENNIKDTTLKWQFADRRPGDIEKIWADTTKMSQTIGWKPKYTLKDSLIHAWKWQKNLREF